MKKIFFILVLLSTVFCTWAQNPVTWSFSAKKLADKKYEIHLTATVQSGWHLYSQLQPEDAVVNPTSFVFNPNPLLAAEGKIKETGKMEKFHDEKLGISANQYAGT